MDIDSQLIDLWITYVSENGHGKNLGENAWDFIQCLKAAKQNFENLGEASYLLQQDDDGSRMLHDCYVGYHEIGGENDSADVELANSDYEELITIVLNNINFHRFDCEWLIVEYHNRP